MRVAITYVTFLTRRTAATSWNHLSEAPDRLTLVYSCSLWLFTSKYTFNNSLQRERYAKKVYSSAASMSQDRSLKPKRGITATLRVYSSSLQDGATLFSLLSLWMMLNKCWHQKQHIVPQIQNKSSKKRSFFKPFSHSLQQKSQVYQTLK